MDIYKYCVVLSILSILFTLYFIKQRKIEFNYGLFWILIGAFLIIISINPDFLERASKFFGIEYAPSFLFVSGIVLNITITFYLTLKVSDIKRKTTRLIQEVGIIKSYFNNEDDHNVSINTNKYNTSSIRTDSLENRSYSDRIPVNGK